MPNIWTYQGEAGKALDASIRPLDGSSVKILFPALGVEMASWFHRRRNLTEGGLALPQAGQVVSIFRDGARFFRGTALRPDFEDFTVGVQIAGPWKWLEDTGLSIDVTLAASSGGGTGPRATMGFPAQSMTTSLGALINRCIALGAPFTRGTIAATFACIPITINQRSCAVALSELVRLIGDMTVWFDHSGGGLPILNITRRRAGISGSATAVTLDAGDMEPGKFKVVPMDELRVSQVRVPFITRAPAGNRLYQEQRAGTAEAGHVLLLTASGEEVDTFLPNDKAQSYLMQTTGVSGAALKTWVMNRDSNIVAAAQAVGLTPAALPINIGPAGLGYANPSSNLPNLNKTVSVPSTRFLNAAGQNVSTSGMQLLASEALPEWLKNQYTVVPVKVTGSLYFEFKESDYDNRVLTNSYQVPSWWYGVQWSSTDGAGFKGTNNRDYSGYQVFIHNFELDAVLINTSVPAPTTIYEAPKYQFIQPPAGFAQGLLDARKDTPYQGILGWQEQECGATRYMGKVINVTGSDPAFASMRAMVQSEELDLESGRTTLRLGPPARHDFPSLLEQTPAFSAQQIVYL